MMKKLFFFPVFLLLASLLLPRCAGDQGQKVADNVYPVVPRPVKLEPQEGRFLFTPDTRIVCYPDNAELKQIGTFFSDLLKQPAGFSMAVMNAGSDGSDPNTLFLALDTTLTLNDEGYLLDITTRAIEVKAKSSRGIFYAIQTLRQLLPPQVEGQEKMDAADLSVPCVRIEDQPRFPYRGLHLDVGRHFFPKEFILRYLDLMALYKFNTFHWHLTEDQGWRIEIKKYPKLTQTGSCRKETVVGHWKSKGENEYDGKEYCGYYTQEDVKEVVAHAKDLYITVIPEIEMPGHSLAALASYPSLGCTGGPYEVATHWGVFKDIYCAGNDSTFKFLEDVLTEVMDLFPSHYIHIGGDEAPKDRWKKCPKCQARIKAEGLKDEHELQSYFIRRIEKFLNAHGRDIIGWDEILEGGLAPNATVMSWRGIKGGIAAAKQHHDVIMTPTNYCYLDYYQGDKEKEPLAIGGFLPLEKVYAYEPVPEELTSEEAKYILGAQGNVWTEYMPTEDIVEYMVYPRACALSEVAWTLPQEKNYEDFLARLKGNLEHLKVMGVKYRPVE